LTLVAAKRYFEKLILKLNLKDLDEGEGERELPITPEAIDGSIAKLADEGVLSLSIYNAKTEIAFEAGVSVSVVLECARCTKEFELPLELEFSFTARPGKAKSVEDEEEDVLHYDSNEPELDLTKLVTEEISVSLPMMPVCSETCKGFCSGCGVNLNTSTCSCKAEKVSSVFEILKNLKRE